MTHSGVDFLLSIFKDVIFKYFEVSDGSKTIICCHFDFVLLSELIFETWPIRNFGLNFIILIFDFLFLLFWVTEWWIIHVLGYRSFHLLFELHHFNIEALILSRHFEKLQMIINLLLYMWVLFKIIRLAENEAIVVYYAFPVLRLVCINDLLRFQDGEFIGQHGTAVFTLGYPQPWHGDEHPWWYSHVEIIWISLKVS